MANYPLPSELVAQVKALTAWCVRLSTALRGVGAWMHADFTTLNASPTAADLATVLVMANALKAAYNAHGASASAHVAADATNVVAAVDATDAATSYTLLNEIKADFNAHIALAASHYDLGGAGGDATPAAVATTDASTLGTSITLANALKAALNRHFAAGASDPTVTL